MTPTREELERLLAEASALPWAYRPQEHDDWGVIRSMVKVGGYAQIAAQARGGSHVDFPEHRANGTDPFGPNALLIVAAVNALPSLLTRLAHLEAENAALVERLSERQPQSADSFETMTGQSGDWQAALAQHRAALTLRSKDDG